MNVFRFAVRDILRTKGLSLFFILNLTFGLLGFVVIESFRDAVDRRLTQNSQEVLGADISISGRRDLSKEELQSVERMVGTWPQNQQVELYSMLSLDESSRLVQIKTLQADFPFYGNFRISVEGKTQKSLGRDLNPGEVWIYPELRDQLGLNLGQQVRLGDSFFKITGIVEDDVGSVWGAFSLAPRVFIRSESLVSTKLLTEGSLATYYRLIKTPEGQDPNTLASEIAQLLKDPGLRVVSHRRAAEQAGRFLQYFADYLGLVAVVGLVLSSLGLSYLCRMFFQSKLKEIAILQSLGLSVNRVLSVFVVQLLILGIFSCITVNALMFPFFAWLKVWIFELVQMKLDLVLNAKVLVGAFLLSTFGLVVMLLPEIQRLRFVQPLILFREFAQSSQESTASILWRLPAVVLFCGLSVYQAHSWKMGLGFSLSILLVSVVVTTLAAWILNGLSKRKVNGIGFRFSLRNLARGGVATITSILALSIGSLILVLMPQIRSSLTSEIKRPPTGELPSLFLFDIQPEQLEGLKLFAKEEGFELQTVSPLIRARLESVNGKGFDKANVNESRFFREEEQEDRTRNRTYNLTYRGELSKSEEIIAGKYVGEWKSSEVAPISVEERFAENLGVKLGDVLKFDVQGVEIEGRVESLRRVRWTSFQPNFFVQFPNGVLNEAPQIYLASVPPMDIKTKSTFQMGVVRKFSNISMIDVDRTLEKLLKIVDLISVVLNAMALLSIIVGFFVLTSILVDQLSRRERDVVLLKLLGADFKTIRKTLIREYWMLSLTGACTGAFFGIGLAWLLTKYVFEGVWQSDLVSAMTVIVGLFLVSDLITRTLVERTLRRTRTVVSL